MGDRANIQFQEEDGGNMFFYTHGTGYRLPKTLRDALLRGKNRWNDEQYLARIIFCEMVKDACGDETGYGLSTSVGDGENRILLVGMKMRVVTIVLKGKHQRSYTFAEYAALENPAWGNEEA